MVRTRLMWLAVFAALIFAARGASAQAVGAAFGQKGQVAISAERLLGVYVLNAEAEQTGTTTFGGGTENVTLNTETDTTTVVLLGSGTAAGPATIPRLAVDFFVIDGLSIGGSLLYWNNSAEDEDTGTTTAGPGGGPNPLDRDRTETDTNLLGIAPRVGYAYMFSPTFGIWPRGGFSYVRTNTESKNEVIDAGDGSVDVTDTETTQSLFSLTLEGLFVISPFEHLAFGVGPFFEWGFSGDTETEISNPPALVQVEGELTTTSFGITSALIAWF